MECNFCKKTFSTNSSLNNHKLTAKYCLKIQQKDINDKFKCSSCDKNFTSKNSLNDHNKICKKNEISLKGKDIIIEQLEKQIKKQDEIIKELQDKLERLASTAISKPTINNNTKITLIAPLDLSHERITNIVTAKLNGDHIVDGMAGIAKFVKDEIITQEGNLLYECVDPSRHIYKYKNDKGELVKDKGATKLIGAIQPALKEKTNDLFFEYKDKITNFIPDEEDKKNIFNKKDTFMYLKDEALKIHGDISDMHKNTKFSTELSNQVTK